MKVKSSLKQGCPTFLAAIVMGCFCVSIISVGCGRKEQELKNVSKGQASFRDSEGKEVATASLTETPDGVNIGLNITDLPKGKYTLRLHSFGKCDPPYFISTGGMFSPGSENKGTDWPVFSVSADGTGRGEASVRRVTLGGRDEDLERSLLFRPGGTSLVIHKYLSKDYPVGDKIACSVVRSEDGNQDVAHPPDGTLRSAEHPKRLDTPEGKIYRPPEGTTYRSPEGTPVKRP